MNTKQKHAARIRELEDKMAAADPDDMHAAIAALAHRAEIAWRKEELARSPFRPGVRVHVRGGSMGGKPITGIVVTHPEPSCFSDTVRVELDEPFRTTGKPTESYYTSALEVIPW